MSIKSNITELDKLINKAQVNITTILKDIQKGSVNIGGVLKVFYEALWYLYNLGVEAVTFIQGYTSSVSSIYRSYTKYTGYMELKSAYANTVACQIGCSTNVVIDITKYKTVYVDWEDYASGNGAGNARLVISTTSTDSAGVNVTASLIHSDHFTRQIESLDISQLTGLYYIRLHSASSVSSSNCYLKIYKIWFE